MSILGEELATRSGVKKKNHLFFYAANSVQFCSQGHIFCFRCIRYEHHLKLFSHVNMDYRIIHVAWDLTGGFHMKGNGTVGNISGQLCLSKVWDLRCWVCLGLPEQSKWVQIGGEAFKSLNITVETS